MSQESPWSIKGIKSGNRETAKEQAFRRGITIGEWINGLIETAGSEYSNDFHGQNYAMSSVPSDMRPANPHRNQQASVFGEGETSRLARAMESLNRKLDNAVGFGTPANFEPRFGELDYKEDFARVEKATERAITSIIERLENSDRNNNQNFNRISTTLSDVKQAQDTIHERVRRLEQDDPSNRSIVALRALESQLQKLAHQIIANEERTDKIAKDVRAIGEDKSSRLNPEDVEKILNGQIGSYKSEVSRQFDEIGNRIASVEEIATVSIEQTDKGITLLSDRVRDAELSTAKATENVKEALVDLSARISQIESNAPSAIKQAIDGRFSSIANKFDEIESKFQSLQQHLIEKLNASENDTLNAIEKIGDQMVKTSNSVEERIKAFENLNETAKDHSLSTRIELGRISHAIDTRLSALENRDSDISKKAGDQISRLAEQITNRLEDVEEKTNNFMSQFAKENRALLDSLNQTKDSLSLDLHNKFEEINHRIDQKLDDRFATFSKAGDSRINQSLEEIIGRLDSIEARGTGLNSETIYQPKGFGFQDGPGDLKPFSASEDIFNNGIDLEDQSTEQAFKTAFGNSEIGNGHIMDDKSDPVFDITGAEERDENLLNQWSNNSAQEKGKDYLNNARRAAIEAANAASQGKKKTPLKAQKPKANQKQKLEALEPVFDELISNTPKKEKGKAPLSPLGMVAAGALVIATATTGYMYLNGNKKQPDQSELPNALKDTAPLPVPTPAPQNIADHTASDANGVAPIASPDSSTSHAPSEALSQHATPPASNNGAQNAVKPNVPAEAKGNPQKSLNGAGAQTISPAPKPHAALEQPKTLTPVNPFKVPPKQNIGATPQPQPVRVASANPTTPPKPMASPSVGNLFDQAMAKQKQGDVKAAIALLTKSAEAGDVKSLNKLAKMFEKGDGVSKNMQEARKWTEKAAKLGSKQALHNLGVYYAEGDGAAQDFSKAAENFAKAAKKGVTDSQFNLGAMSEQGLGVPKNKSEAYYWYSLAAKNGDADAVKKSKEISSALNPQEKALLDKKIESFKSENSTPD